MRIALCLKGNIGGNAGKSKDRNLPNAKKSFDCWKKNLIDINDIDVFFHCWDKQYEEELLKWYNPKKYLFEEQIDFKNNNLRFFATKSNAYSSYKSITLMNECELSNNMKYDIVILSRFDVSIFKKIDFDKETLSLNDTLYHTGTSPIHKFPQYPPEICVGGCCDKNSWRYEIGDLMFFSNSNNMYKFITEIYHNINEYYNKYKSNHVLSYHQAKKQKLKLDCLLYTKTYNIYRNENDGNICLTRWMV